VSQNNAWVIVDGVVYDVTGWIEEHPGGPDLLAKRAGQDVTETFRFLRVGFRA
jgi:cytochrome b5